LSGSRRDEIAELAEIVAQEYCPAGRVDPELIAKKKDITISYGHYKDAYDGLLEYDLEPLTK
jgi:hypothetical protein